MNTFMCTDFSRNALALKYYHRRLLRHAGSIQNAIIYTNIIKTIKYI